MPKCLAHYADIMRARAYRNRQRQRNYDISRINTSDSRQPYTDNECAAILEHSITDRELSKIIGHSVASIQHKRHDLKHSVTDRKKGT